MALWGWGWVLGTVLHDARQFASQYPDRSITGMMAGLHDGWLPLASSPRIDLRDTQYVHGCVIHMSKWILDFE